MYVSMGMMESMLTMTAADASMNKKIAAQEDISRIIRSIKRDERILTYEAELRMISEEHRKLREELLPVFRIVKERSQPLPSPNRAHSPDFDKSHDSLSSPVLAQPPQTAKSNTPGR